MKKTLKTFAALLALVLAIALSLVACDDPLGPDTGDSSPSVSDSSDTGSSDSSDTGSSGTGDVGSSDTGSDTGSDSSEQPAPKVTVPNRSEGQMIQEEMFDQLVYWFTTSEEYGKVIDMAYDPYYDEDGYAHFSYAYQNGASGAWGFQMFYINSKLNPGTSYRLSFDIDVLSENGGNITVNGKTVTLVKGENHVEVTYVEQAPALDGANATSLSSLDIQSGLTALEFTLSPITDACWTESELDPQPDQTELFSSDEGYARSNPGVYVIWLDNGGQLTENKIDEEGIHFAYTTTSTQWYGVQLFYKNSTNVAGKKYKLSMTLTSDVEDDITVNGQVVHITAGANDIEVEYVEDEGSICSLDVQMGKDGDNAHIVPAAEIDITNLSWEEVVPHVEGITLVDISFEAGNDAIMHIHVKSEQDPKQLIDKIVVNDKEETALNIYQFGAPENMEWRIDFEDHDLAKAAHYTIVLKKGETVVATLESDYDLGGGEEQPGDEKPEDYNIQFVSVEFDSGNPEIMLIRVHSEKSIVNLFDSTAVVNEVERHINNVYVLGVEENKEYVINISVPGEKVANYKVALSVKGTEFVVLNFTYDVESSDTDTKCGLPKSDDYVALNLEFVRLNGEYRAILHVVCEKDITAGYVRTHVNGTQVACDVKKIEDAVNTYEIDVHVGEIVASGKEYTVELVKNIEGGSVVYASGSFVYEKEEVVDPVPDELAVEFVEAKTYAPDWFRLVVRSASDLVSLKNVTITVDGYAVTVAIDGPLAWEGGNTAYNFMKPADVAETLGQHTIVLKIGEKEFTFENVTVVAE